MNTKHGILLVGIGLLLFCVFVSCVSARIWYVPDDFLEIQWAIDSAEDYDTIIVRDGTYSAWLNVDKPLTIRSENGSNSTILASDASTLVTVGAKNVTIDGFTIEGASGAYGSGVAIKIGSHCIISNNSFQDNDQAIYGGGHYSKILNNTISGVSYGRNGLDLSLDKGVVAGNKIYGNGGPAIRMSHCYDTLVVDNKIYEDNLYGVYIEYGARNSILNNEICQSRSDDGIYIRGSLDNIILGNEIYDNKGNGIHLLYSYDCKNNTISKNKIYGNRGAGIYLDAKENTILNNEISANDYYSTGLRLDGPDNTILNNTFVNCGLGVFSENIGEIEGNYVEGNTVNGKPLVYLEDKENVKITGAGQVILLKCQKITVKNCDVSQIWDGIKLLESSDCKILENNLSETGMFLDESSRNNSLLKNEITKSWVSVYGTSWKGSIHR